MKKNLFLLAALLVLFSSGCSELSPLNKNDGENVPPAVTSASKPRVIVTGFEPFGGRKDNGSWMAAESLKDSGLAIIQALQLPVVWGEPKKHLEPLCRENPPQIIISMGEGRPGFFDIEVVARNIRIPILDNRRQSPPQNQIEPGGPDEFTSTIPAEKLCEALKAKGFPVRVSRDAGAYLCEEALYTLELLRSQNPQIKTVIFVHLPPLGTRVQIGENTVTSDRALMSSFASELLIQVLLINKEVEARE